ncbi:MAG: Hsp70 family protein [Planctomycetes bacterium]|nr:Hsp70 family protein [Planctomycetota bacterium]
MTAPSSWERVKQAGELAGLTVHHLMNEPTAAAYAYCVQHAAKDQQTFLVYDLGGGKLDVAVVKLADESLRILGSSGDPCLGGANFDDCIVDWMMEELRKDDEYQADLTDSRRRLLRTRLKVEAEAGKINLCTNQVPYTFRIPGVDKVRGRPVPFQQTLTPEIFRQLIEHLIDHSMHHLDEALTTGENDADDLAAVLLVGGSTYVPRVRERVQQRFANVPLWGRDRGINPVEAVVLGASIRAAELNPDVDRAPFAKIIDTTAHTLSIAVFESENNREILDPLILKNTPIPCEASREFHTMPRAERFSIRLYRGEGRDIDPRRVTMIGEFEIPVQPRRESVPIRLMFKVEEDGIVRVRALDLVEGRQVEVRLRYDEGAVEEPRSQRELERVEPERPAPVEKPSVPPSVKRAFISYSTIDSQAAQTVCATLENHGLKCWIAPRDIMPGMSYGGAICTAIEECRLLILVLSSASNASEQVLREVEIAASERRPILPLRIEDVTLSKSLRYFIGTQHWLNAMTPPLESHLDALVSAVKQHMAAPG